MTLRGAFAWMLAVLSTTVFAATITTVSPVSGDFLGKSNTVRFNITGAVQQVEVTVLATNVANPAITFTVKQKFTPDPDGRIEGSITLNFADSTPGGPYTIAVTASEPGNFYNTPPVIPVTIDVTSPKFVNFNPVSGGFVKDIVSIIVSLLEDNIDEWRVQINGSDIPNNTGSTADFLVSWDTSLISTDGSQNISINVKDKAGNSASQSVSVTLDRVKPTSDILSPRTGDTIRPNSTIPVVVSVTDQYSNSLDVTGIDVVITDLAGAILGRVARRNFTTSGNTVTWTGRIRAERGFPSQFKVVVNATDRAGNQAVVQEVTVSTAGRGIDSGQSVTSTNRYIGGNATRGQGASGKGTKGNGSTATGRGTQSTGSSVASTSSNVSPISSSLSSAYSGGKNGKANRGSGGGKSGKGGGS